jgi:hypothetical protein
MLVEPQAALLLFRTVARVTVLLQDWPNFVHEINCFSQNGWGQRGFADEHNAK